ncbi:MAG: hypothetical protein GY835_12670 [bacterium]|nr:hypothetical protein [bacterium]
MSGSGELSILFVDHELEQMSAYIEYLELEGHQVTRCRYVEELSDYVEEGTYDMIILNTMMPRKSLKNNETSELDRDYVMEHAGIQYGAVALRNVRIPIIILTDTPASEIWRNKALIGIRVSEVCQKLSTTPARLANIVRYAGDRRS